MEGEFEGGMRLVEVGRCLFHVSKFKAPILPRSYDTTIIHHVQTLIQTQVRYNHPSSCLPGQFSGSYPSR